MTQIRTEIQGLQDAQDAMLRGVLALRPEGALGEAVKATAIRLHRYASAITHVDTGALRLSHTIRLAKGQAEIFINPAARNPRGGRPAVYGPYEHARGGTHAFYRRTVTDRGRSAASEGVKVLLRALP